jgi:hypothetical protein
MAEQATVTIAEYTTKSGVTNGRDWTVHFLLDGNKTRYSTLDSAIGAKIKSNSGQQVDIEYDTNEKGYKTVTSIKAHKDASTQKDDTIVREVALKAAASFLAGAGTDYTVVIDVADKFAKWIQEEPAAGDPGSAEDDWDPQA